MEIDYRDRPRRSWLQGSRLWKSTLGYWTWKLGLQSSGTKIGLRNLIFWSSIMEIGLIELSLLDQPFGAWSWKSTMEIDLRDLNLGSSASRALRWRSTMKLELLELSYGDQSYGAPSRNRLRSSTFGALSWRSTMKLNLLKLSHRNQPYRARS